MSDVSRAYGGALYELADEENLTDGLLEETDAVARILGENPDYIRLLSTPDIPTRERREAIAAAFATAHPYLRNFLCLTSELGYAGEIPGCLAEFRRVYNERHGIAEARITSARELSDEQKERLMTALAKRLGVRIDPTYAVEPDLIGGLSVEAAGVLLDGTVRHRLDGIREALGQLTL